MSNKLKVSEVFNIYTDTNYEVLRLTPKDEYKGKIKDPKIMCGDEELPHNEVSNGVISLRAADGVDSVSVKNCWVSFDHKM